MIKTKDVIFLGGLMALTVLGIVLWDNQTEMAKPSFTVEGNHLENSTPEDYNAILLFEPRADIVRKQLQNLEQAIAEITECNDGYEDCDINSLEFKTETLDINTIETDPSKWFEFDANDILLKSFYSPDFLSVHTEKGEIKIDLHTGDVNLPPEMNAIEGARLFWLSIGEYILDCPCECNDKEGLNNF